MKRPPNPGLEDGGLTIAKRRYETERLTDPSVPVAPRDLLPGLQETARARAHWGGAEGAGPAGRGQAILLVPAMCQTCLSSRPTSSGFLLLGSFESVWCPLEPGYLQN